MSLIVPKIDTRGRRVDKRQGNSVFTWRRVLILCILGVLRTKCNSNVEIIRGAQQSFFFWSTDIIGAHTVRNAILNFSVLFEFSTKCRNYFSVGMFVWQTINCKIRKVRKIKTPSLDPYNSAKIAMNGGIFVWNAQNIKLLMTIMVENKPIYFRF